MIPLTTLWLPILLSTVFVFIASNILHMAIPAWHRADYGKLPDEKPVGVVHNGAAAQRSDPAALQGLR